MKIGFLCAHNPYDRNSFSGTAYYAFHALKSAERHGGLEQVKLLTSHDEPSKIRRFMSKFCSFLRNKSTRPQFINSEIGNIDYVVSLVSTELALATKHRHNARLVHVTDATPRFLREFYGHDVSESADIAEAEIIEMADRVIYSSKFMMERAIKEFGDRYESKISYIPFGVNLDHLPTSYRPASQLPGKPSLNLLFIGKEWERKGGPLSLRIVKRLREIGVDARLTVIGCNPPIHSAIEHLSIFPFLNKNTTKDRLILEKILKDSHLLLLPTRADCTPMVVAEANAHSIPAIITDVGGVSSLVESGNNGLLIPLNEDADHWANEIIDFIKCGERYEKSRELSFITYAERLNWKSWTQELVIKLLHSDK